ncbi:hypothetical protein LTR56_004922 [Elasticomyces elasticus]|nr:hypothetical protein LTR56_004922 [Elasticomyces elasticus]KAK3664694.1 hypothetical protein LTR22_004564 [Elasticomyces elasticus]KAK4913717.1 hypothetical protein LTR49_017972 [Elasticomyces elasticus]KAK5754771.1 hypothetical protein LTS12_015182 [Elasticomyces elasticus]
MAAKDKDGGLYGLDKKRNLSNGKTISSSTSLAFSSQLGALINNASSSSATTSGTNKSSKSNNLKRKKDDLFNRGTAKRAKRGIDTHERGVVEQKHSSHSEALEEGVWARSRRKMEEKARLYAAMKRGDVEDTDERYAVDFDKKWAERSTQDDEEIDDSGQSSEDGDDGGGERGGGGQVEYQDEFGRTRTGTAAEAARVKRAVDAGKDIHSDRFTARPSAPANVIYGDTIQHNAFDPDSLPIAGEMDALARKRDTSLTPPPEEHFDGNKEIRTKGTAFMQFSGDADERARQMKALAAEREETERKRKEREAKVGGRKAVLDARRKEIQERRGKRKAEAFLDELGVELVGKGEVREGAEGDDGDGEGGLETAAAGEGD